MFYKGKWPNTLYPCQVLEENIDSEKVVLLGCRHASVPNPFVDQCLVVNDQDHAGSQQEHDGRH